jgi:hypothetical protein
MCLISHKKVYYQACIQVFNNSENKLTRMHTQVATPVFESTSARCWVRKYYVDKCLQGVRDHLGYSETPITDFEFEKRRHAFGILVKEPILKCTTYTSLPIH